jgi:hypothetical protein
VQSTFPASFNGGPTFYAQHVGCALYTASKLGCEQVLFTTMTCNSKWRAAYEVASESHRPSAAQVDNSNFDTLVRAFLCARRKPAQLMRRGACLPKSLQPPNGKSIWYLEAIEYQGRGLPHVHRLDFYGGKRWTVDDIDHIVWARIPTDEEDAFFKHLYDGVSLRDLVTSLMQHKHCIYCAYDEYKKIPCRFGFPFKELAQTRFHSDGKVLYKRGPLDGWTVSYNPYLLCAARAHINTTVACGAAAIPYICKYLGKGDSCARAAIIKERTQARKEGTNCTVDPTRVYEQYRTVGASEALARILDAAIINQFPSVITVRVKTPALKEVDDVVKNPAPSPSDPAKTKYYNDVERWLLRPMEFADMNISLYFGSVVMQPAYCDKAPPAGAVIHMDRAHGNPRKVWRWVCGGHQLCRLHPVHDLNSELFWLRQILIQPGCKALTLENLRTAPDEDGSAKVLPSYSATANALGLQKNAAAAEMVLKEAIADRLCNAKPLRSDLYVLISHFPQCSGDLLRLVDTYQEWLADPEWPECDRRKLILRDMHVRLQLDGKHLSKYGEEAVCVAQLSSVPAGPSLMVDDAFLPSNVTLNPQQKAIYDVVVGFLQRSNPRDPKVVHIEAFAGAGKTFLCKVLAMEQ